MKKHKTNIDLITDIMTYSRNGAMIQSFVVCALDTYSKQIIDAYNNNELTQEQFSIVNMESWVDCAKEVLEKYQKHWETKVNEQNIP